jgi:preprotein translocase subunit SecA
VRRLQAGRDYVVDEKHHAVTLTEEGTARLEQMMGIPNLAEAVDLLPYINAALKAHGYFKKDVHYVVRGGEIIIVDEFTGRPDARQTLQRRHPPSARSQRGRAHQTREPGPSPS